MPRLCDPRLAIGAGRFAPLTGECHGPTRLLAERAIDALFPRRRVSGGGISAGRRRGEQEPGGPFRHGNGFHGPNSARATQMFPACRHWLITSYALTAVATPPLTLPALPYPPPLPSLSHSSTHPSRL